MSNQIVEARNEYIDQLLKQNQDLEAKLKVCEEHKNEFLGQRNAYGQLAYSLAEHIKALDQGKTVRYPVHLIAQVDLARGVAGRYEFPNQGRSIPEIASKKIE